MGTRSRTQLFPYGNFTGRNLMPILDGALGLLEETAADGQGISEVLGDDIPGFLRGAGRRRRGSDLSRPVARAVEPERRQETEPTGRTDVSIQDIIEGKKQWRAHMARVKALPPDYQIVYKEIQKYLFKVGPVDLPDGPLLPEIVDFFEEGVAAARESWNSLATDVAAFCDGLIGDTPTFADLYQQSNQSPRTEPDQR